MRILVTGGSGYLGSILVPRLTSERHEVEVLDIQPPTSSVRWVNADVNSADLGMFKTYDAIVHLAGIVGDAACNKEPTKAVETNYLTTKRLANEFARSNKKMVFASTCSVYGASNSLQTEDTDPSPLSLYGLTKLQSEKPVIENTQSRISHQNVQRHCRPTSRPSSPPRAHCSTSSKPMSQPPTA